CQATAATACQVGFNPGTPPGPTDRSAAPSFRKPTTYPATDLTCLTWSATRADVLRLPSPAVTPSDAAPPLPAPWAGWEKGRWAVRIRGHPDRGCGNGARKTCRVTKRLAPEAAGGRWPG